MDPFYNTDYDSEEDLNAPETPDPILLLKNTNVDDLVYHSANDIKSITRRSSYFKHLEKNKTYAIKDQFLNIEKNHIRLLRALRLSNRARYLVRKVINVSYGYPSEETPSAGDKAKQRMPDATADSGTNRDHSGLREGDDAKNITDSGSRL